MSLALKYIGWCTLWLWFIYGSGMLLLKHYLPEVVTPWLATIPAMFTLLAVLTFKKGILDPNVPIALALAIRVGRLLFSMLFILAYALLVKAQTVTFLIAFALFYSFYLIFETWLTIKVNKSSKIVNEK